MQIRYHTTVTSGLQTVLRYATKAPYYALVTPPISKAEQVAKRLAERYPTITATPHTRSAIRQVGYPVVSMVAMPPDPKKGTLTLILLATTPPDDREEWHLCLDPDWPLQWRNYQMCQVLKAGYRQPKYRHARQVLTSDTTRRKPSKPNRFVPPAGAKVTLSWCFTPQARGNYEERLRRLITGRGTGKGKLAEGQKLRFLPDDVAREQLRLLAKHLSNYPGFAGIRYDVFELGQYATQMWYSTRRRKGRVLWWHMLWATQFITARTAPLSDVVANVAAPNPWPWGDKA